MDMSPAYQSGASSSFRSQIFSIAFILCKWLAKLSIGSARNWLTREPTSRDRSGRCVAIMTRDTPKPFSYLKNPALWCKRASSVDLNPFASWHRVFKTLERLPFLKTRLTIPQHSPSNFLFLPLLSFLFYPLKIANGRKRTVSTDPCRPFTSIRHVGSGRLLMIRQFQPAGFLWKVPNEASESLCLGHNLGKEENGPRRRSMGSAQRRCLGKRCTSRSKRPSLREPLPGIHHQVGYAKAEAPEEVEIKVHSTTTWLFFSASVTPTAVDRS